MPKWGSLKQVVQKVSSCLIYHYTAFILWHTNKLDETAGYRRLSDLIGFLRNFNVCNVIFSTIFYKLCVRQKPL